MEQQRTTLYKGIILGLGMVLFAIVMQVGFFYLEMEGGSLFPILFLTLIFGGACAVFFFQKERQDLISLCFIMAVLAGLFALRFALLPYVSRDYQVFLSDWVEQIRQAPGLSALSQDIGDYNMPYLYILFAIAKLSHQDLFYIKLFSIAFDAVAAFFAMRLVSLRTGRQGVHFAAFAAVLIAPTVVFNGAYWGQCDVVFTALGLGSLYFGLKEKSRLSYLFLALAFSFKLQTVFFFPAFLVLLLLRKVRLRDAWVFPVTFAGVLVPALLAGKPLLDTVSIYGEQTASYPYLVLNTPSIYRLVGEQVDFYSFDFLGIFLAGTVCALFLYYIYEKRACIDTGKFVELSFLFALVMPYLLPRMHDRYFFVADVLSIVYFFYRKEKWYVPLVVLFSSYCGYYYYLMGARELVNQKWPALALLVVIILCARTFVMETWAPEKKREETIVLEESATANTQKT